MEVRLADFTSEAVDAENGEGVEDNVEAGELVQDRHSHSHEHVHDDLEGLHFLKELADAKVSQ